MIFSRRAKPGADAVAIDLVLGFGVNSTRSTLVVEYVKLNGRHLARDELCTT